MPLTPSEIAATAGQYLVIGRRSDGTELILMETRTPEMAEAIRSRLVPLLEGYTDVVVERVGAAPETSPATPD